MGLESDAAVIADSLERPARFAVLYERHVWSVERYLARRVGADLAEDLTAEVFVRAFQARGRFRAEYETARPWLLGIANHLIGDHRRAERRRLAALHQLACAIPAESHEDSAGLAPDLIRRLQRLPAADRDAMLLVAWGELTYEETARALEVPVGTVRSRIARARRRLVNTADGDPSERGWVEAADAKGETNVA